MITTFENYLRYNRGLSEHTCKAYAEDLRDFASHINCYHPGTHWSGVTKVMIDEYVVSMVSEDYEASTIKRHVSALRTFFKTCMALGKMESNPARYVSTPKLGKQEPKTIEVEAIRRTLASPLTHPQAKAAIAIIYETGIRLQELLDIKASDIDSRTASIRIHGKGNKERTVYYGDLTRQYGKCWRGSSLDQRTVRRLVFEALKPYSLAPMLCPHAIRHTFASRCLENGMPMEAIQKLLGHEHITTTEIYAQLPTTKMREYYDQYRPAL